MADVGDVAPVGLAETNQHAPLLLDKFGAKPAFAAIAPRRIGQRRKYTLRHHLADALEIFEQHALLRRDLRDRIEMLQRAAATDAEMRAARRDAVGRGAQHFLDCRLVVMPMLAGVAHAHALARERPGDEHGLAGDVGHAAAIVSEVGDIGFEYGHL